MISETHDLIVPEDEEEGSYLNLVLIKIRVALKEELEKNEWKIEIADDQRIVVERLLDVADTSFEAAADFDASEMDGIDYSDLIPDDDSVCISKDDLFGALPNLDADASPERHFVDLPEEAEVAAVVVKKKRGRRNFFKQKNKFFTRYLKHCTKFPLD